MLLKASWLTGCSWVSTTQNVAPLFLRCLHETVHTARRFP
jgi:hypothetical protein